MTAHFDIAEWIDFARGVAPPGRYEILRAHLAGGCGPCAETAEFLVRVYRAGRQLSGQQVPAEWSRKAEDIFQDETLGSIQSLPVLRAAPAFLSLASEAAMLRSGEVSPGHLIYEAADCAVNLRFERGAEPRDLSIVGQITDRRDPDKAIKPTPVFLLNRDKLVARTSSNEFGEFQIACKLKRQMLLSFPFDGTRIDVMLDRFPNQEL